MKATPAAPEVEMTPAGPTVVVSTTVVEWRLVFLVRGLTSSVASIQITRSVVAMAVLVVVVPATSLVAALAVAPLDEIVAGHLMEDVATPRLRSVLPNKDRPEKHVVARRLKLGVS